jgi:hypothetical protein
VFVIDIPGSGQFIDSPASEGTDQKFITIRRGKAAGRAHENRSDVI